MKIIAILLLSSAFVFSSCANCNHTSKVYFSPPGRDLENAIVAQIGTAHSQILVQAYGFTSDAIVEALLQAEKRPNVDVEVLLDKSNETSRQQKWKQLKKAGVTVEIDDEGGIAHNKIMVIDSNVVVTGSFNFTEHAKRNEENVLILNDHDLAMQYIDNWNKREEFSRDPKRR